MKINEGGTHGSEMKDSVNFGQYTVSMISGILQNKKVTGKTKHSIYNTIIKNTVLYDSEIWHFKKKTNKIWQWKWIFGGNHQEYQGNKISQITYYRKKCVYKPIFWMIKRQHTAQTSAQVIPLGRRKRRRLRVRWVKGIHYAMGEKEVEGMDGQRRMPTINQNTAMTLKINIYIYIYNKFFKNISKFKYLGHQ
jgi:hypothetical protein